LPREVAKVDDVDKVDSDETDGLSRSSELAPETEGVFLAPGVRRVRLHFLDGLRGLAALYVLLFHSLTISVPQEGQELGIVMRSLRSVFGYGHFAVAVFIVLSGFSLMLPLARSGSTELQRGFGSYMFRRCRRVFPPYYAALVLSIAALIASSAIPGSSGESTKAALSPGSLLSHLLLVHNVNMDWAFRINGPMWSVATEFQIYFLFPLVLLPLWRIRGAGFTIAAAWAVALLLHFALPSGQNFSWAAPWFVGSFAMGMWGATVGFGDGDAARRFFGLPWGRITLFSLAVLVTIVATSGQAIGLPLLDALVSLMALAWILTCVRRHAAADADGRERSAMNRFLGSPPLVLLGGFSYSLYVLQHPLLRLTEALLGETSLGYEAVLWVQLVIGTPLIMAAALLFAEIFELPFTTGSHILGAIARRRGRSSRPSELALPTPDPAVPPGT
jgi:peptidoglycan/LPS O-acetylase OafA/YrhL